MVIINIQRRKTTTKTPAAMEGSGGNGGRKSFAASLEIDVPHGDQLQRLEVAVEDESNQSSDDRSRNEPQLPPFSPPSPLPPPPSPSSASPFLHRPTSPTAPSFSSSRKSSMSQVRASLEVTIEGGDTRILSKRIATPRKLTAPRGAPTLPYLCLFDINNTFALLRNDLQFPTLLSLRFHFIHSSGWRQCQLPR